MNDKIINDEIMRFIPGHSRNCSYGRFDSDEGDFCTCDLRRRKEELRKILEERNNNEIQKMQS